MYLSKMKNMYFLKLKLHLSKNKYIYLCKIQNIFAVVHFKDKLIGCARPAQVSNPHKSKPGLTFLSLFLMAMVMMMIQKKLTLN